MTISRSAAVLAIPVLGLLTACSGRTVSTDAQAATAAPVASSHAAAPAPADPAAAGGSAITGTVLETMDASNYTYVRVKAGTRELWAAASQFKVKVGDTVVLSLEQPMENFHSQSLNRDFPLIYFVSRIGREGDSASPSMAVAHGGERAASAQPPAVATPMAAPKDATSVETVWKTRKALAGKTVTVHGKVVKYNPGILGVNWIHLQDGTGAAGDGTNDITVTSDGETKVGDVITVTGIVAIDKDLGSGYKYPVIIERAAIAR
jgi:hypothetical protein